MSTDVFESRLCQIVNMYRNRLCHLEEPDLSVCKYDWSYYYWSLYCNLAIVMIRKYLKSDNSWSIVWIFAMAPNLSFSNCVKKITDGLLRKYSTLWQHKCESSISVSKILYTLAGGPLIVEPLGFSLSSL